jgi:hypothetical protein
VRQPFVRQTAWVKEYERLMLRAAVEHSHEAAREALAKNPLVGRSEIGDQVLSDYIPEFSQDMTLPAT